MGFLGFYNIWIRNCIVNLLIGEQLSVSPAFGNHVGDRCKSQVALFSRMVFLWFC